MSYYYGSSTSGNRCADSSSFEGELLPYTAGQLAIDGFGILASILIAGLYLVVALSKRHAQRVAPWWIYVPAILFSLIAWIIRIVNDVLYNCDVIGYELSVKLGVPSSILFYGLAYLLWLAVLVFPLTLRLLDLAGLSKTLYKIAAGVLWGLTVVFWIAYTACLYTYLLGDDGYQIYGIYDGREKLLAAFRGLIGTFQVLFLVTTLVSSAMVVVSLTKLRNSRASGALKVGLIITLLFWLASNILSMYEVFQYSVRRESNYTLAGTIATGILDILFVIGAAVCMLFVAGSRTWRDQSTPPPYLDGGVPYPGYNAAPGHQVGPKYGPYNGQQEVSGVGGFATYQQAPTNYNHQNQHTGGYPQPTELPSPVAASEVHGHPIRYEAPGQAPAGLH